MLFMCRIRRLLMEIARPSHRAFPGGMFDEWSDQSIDGFSYNKFGNKLNSFSRDDFESRCSKFTSTRCKFS